MCNITKPGGKIIIVASELYSLADWIKWEEIERLEKLGRLHSNAVITENDYKPGHRANIFVYDVL